MHTQVGINMLVHHTRYAEVLIREGKADIIC